MSFKLSAQKEEEIVYDEVKVVQKKAEQAADGKFKSNVSIIYILLLLGTFLVVPLVLLQLLSLL